MAVPRSNRVRGTSLIEVLVVIVIFLVGILAVAQIFPKGFQILVNGRNQSVAQALARDEIERLTARANELPSMIVSATPDNNGNLVINPNVNPNDLGPLGNAINEYGYLTDTVNGLSLGDWTRFSGPNKFRHIIGESRIVPAPRLVGGSSSMYGGLIVLNFGPVDTTNGANTITVYGNDLNATLVPASSTQFPATATQGSTIASVQHTDDEYFVLNPQGNGVTLALPEGPSTLPLGAANGTQNAAANRLYVLSFTAYVQNGTTYQRRDYTNIHVAVPNGTPDNNLNLPLYEETLSSLVPSLGSIDLSSLRVRRGFIQIPASTNFASYEPYACKVLNPSLGVILFSPYAFGLTVTGPSGPQPLEARIDYDVYDWRILREDFRFPANQLAQHQLPVGAIKTSGTTDFDGRLVTVIMPLEGAGSQTAQADNTGNSDNFVLVDLDTGGVYMEKNTAVAAPADAGDTYITVNKSNGLITVKDLEANVPGTQANLLLPDGTIMPNVTVDNRAVRALYVPKYEYAVQVLKAAASYSEFVPPSGSTQHPGAGQFTTGVNLSGGVPTRVYFPVCDLGRKVSAGLINYRDGQTFKQMHDQDFVVAFPVVSDGVGLPCIDVATVDYQATQLDTTTYGYSVSDVKGASVAVRVMWNPNFFRLGVDSSSDLGGNMTFVNNWEHGWRQTINDTYLEQGGLIP